MVGSRPRKKAIVEETSEEEEDELAQDEEDGEAEEEEDGEEEEDDAEGDEDDDAEADEDVDMDDIPPARPAPAATVKAGGAGGLKTKPAVTITPAKEDATASVEDKEMAMGSDDDEEEEEDDDDLSEPNSLEDAAGVEEDAEGELEDEEMLEDDEEGAEADSDDDETPASMSRSHTPDISKLTRRQRGDIEQGTLLALSNEAQKKKHLTAEEHQARRAEMARRRKNLSEKRNEEEKVSS